ncbi:hypothetical protein D3C80_1668690 [compost metagenome]
MLQAGLVGLSCHRVGIVDFGAVDFLEGIHGADGADQLKVAVVTEQIAGKIESQRRSAVRRHEVTHFQSHLPEVFIGQGIFILLVFKAQHRVLVFSAMVSLAARHAQADDRGLGKVLFVGGGVHEALEQLAMQLAKMLRCAERWLVLVVPQ